jgi:hypothetical protein
MQPPRGVLLDHEQTPVARAPRPEGLGRALGVALLPVGLEGSGHNP